MIMGKTEFIIEPGRQDIVMTRVFDAPPDVVFRAYTDPELIPHWWGPAKYPTVVDVAEVRPGGRWRYLSQGEDGEEYGFKGVSNSRQRAGPSRHPGTLAPV
jgi:uncharacterized protein YndB with AHSA1/START domain